jgi:hypothetical protein
MSKDTSRDSKLPESEECEEGGVRSICEFEVEVIDEAGDEPRNSSCVGENCCLRGENGGEPIKRDDVWEGDERRIGEVEK